MHILVTGGAGFIGSHLIEALLALGHDVTAVDNLSLGNRRQIEHLTGRPRFEFHAIDILDQAAFGAVMTSQRFDCVFHLAANSDIARSHDDPGVDFRNTLETTYAVLSAMRASGVRRIVFASTSAVYGEASCALDENHGPLLPVSHYGAAKLASEAFIASFVANYGMQAWIARFANIVGERATHGALFDFINRLRCDPGHLPVRGNGEQAKPYLYVKELVDALLFIWQNADEPLNVFNVGVDSRTSVKQIVRILTDEMRSPPGRALRKVHDRLGGRRGASALSGRQAERLGLARAAHLGRSRAMRGPRHAGGTNMKLVIIAGGKGTRLGTANVPKPMVKIGDHSVLDHQLALAKRYGIRDVLVISGHLAEVTFDHLRDGAAHGMRITHLIEPYPIGTAGSLALAKHLLNERFLVFYGDVMLDMDLGRLIAFDREARAMATLVVHPNDHPQDSDLVEIDDQAPRRRLAQKAAARGRRPSQPGQRRGIRLLARDFPAPDVWRSGGLWARRVSGAGRARIAAGGIQHGRVRQRHGHARPTGRNRARIPEWPRCADELRAPAAGDLSGS